MKRKLSALIFALLLCFTAGCSGFLVSTERSITRLSTIAAANENPQFSLSALLQALYPDTLAVITGTVREQAGTLAFVAVDESIDGSISARNPIAVRNAAGAQLVDGNRYLFFLGAATSDQEDEQAAYTLLTDENGYIRIDGQWLYPVPGVTLELNFLRSELQKLNQRVSAPTYSYYYQTLTGLVASSDIIFIGTVISIAYDVPVSYYMREEGISEQMTENSRQYVLRPTQVLKGEADETHTVLLSPTMIKSTLFETTQDHVAYMESDMPGLYQDGEYLFFLVNSPGGKRGAYHFLINPYQGAVPVQGSDLVGIPVNAVFSMQEPLANMLDRIQSLLENTGDGEMSGSVFDDLWTE